MYLWYFFHSFRLGRHHWIEILEGLDSGTRQTLAALFQFFTFGSETWFFCNSRDLVVTLTDPFVSDKANLRKYHIFAWSVSLFMAAMVVIPWTKRSHNSNNVFGLWYTGGEEIDKYPVYYLTNDKGKIFTLKTIPHVALFYGPVLSIYIYALKVFVETFMQFKKSKGHCAATLSARLHILAANAVNIIIFLGYWTIYTVAYILIYVLSDGPSYTVRAFSPLELQPIANDLLFD